MIDASDTEGISKPLHILYDPDSDILEPWEELINNRGNEQTRFFPSVPFLCRFLQFMSLEKPNLIFLNVLIARLQSCQQEVIDSSSVTGIHQVLNEVDLCSQVLDPGPGHHVYQQGQQVVHGQFIVSAEHPAHGLLDLLVRLQDDFQLLLGVDR